MNFKSYLLVESALPEGKYYHVTLLKHADTIRENGITVGNKRVWNNAFGTELGHTDKIYIFSSKWSAISWAFKMKWETKKDTAIVVIGGEPKGLMPDDHWESQVAPVKDSWWMTPHSIPPEMIEDVVPMSDSLTKEFMQHQKGV